MPLEILALTKQLSFYSGCILFFLGLIGNTINILVFTQVKLFRNDRSAFYLTVEAFSNLLYEFINITSTVLTLIYGNDGTERFLIWCKLRYSLSQLSVLTTYYMISCCAGDQFFSTNYHLNVRYMCTMRLVRYITVILICLWIVHSIVFGVFFQIQPMIGCIIINQIYLQYATFFIYPVLAGLLPITLAIFFSFFAYRNVRRIVRRQRSIARQFSRQMTAMVLIRVILFVCLASPYSFFRIYIINYPISQEQRTKYAIRQLLQILFLISINLNYTMNFYVFMITSARFRRQVKFILVKKCWKRWKHCCCSKTNRIIPKDVDLDAGYT
ncbi:hypothetical protein I4U23_003786 [Adineta vaga]|nr:hypothetical protein I4U23_003786 [Adineta vaga]